MSFGVQDFRSKLTFSAKMEKAIFKAKREQHLQGHLGVGTGKRRSQIRENAWACCRWHWKRNSWRTWTLIELLSTWWSTGTWVQHWQLWGPHFPQGLVNFKIVNFEQKKKHGSNWSDIVHTWITSTKCQHKASSDSRLHPLVNAKAIVQYPGLSQTTSVTLVCSAVHK